MKNLILALLLIAAPIYGVSLKPADQVTCAVKTIYNDGNLAAPDSVRIQVFRNGAELTDDWYNSSDGEASAIDDWLVFTDAIQDIDGAGGDGAYIIIASAYDADSTLYTPFQYSYQVGLADDAADALDSLQLYDTRFDSLLTALADGSISDKVWVDGSPTIRAEIEATLDTLQLYDSRLDSLLAAVSDAAKANYKANVSALALEASLFDPTSDSVIVDVSSAATAGNMFALLVDATWDEILSTHTDAGSVGDVLLDSLDAQVSSAGGTASISDADMAAIADTLLQRDTSGYYADVGSIGEAILESGGGSSTWSEAQRDSALAALADASISDKVWVDGSPTIRGYISTILDSVFAALDTLQNQDNWAATEATVNGIDDNVWDDGTRTLTTADWTTDSDLTVLVDSLNAALDSLQLLDTRFDSLLAAVSDAAKTNYKADVSALATATNLAHARDSIHAVLDSLQNHDDWVAQQASVSVLATAANLTFAIDSINAILDTLQNHDDWVAKEASLPTIASIVDGVWDEDTTGHGTAQSFSVMLKDTTAYQGAGSSLTAETIYDYFIDGSREDQFKTSAGSGPYILHVIAIDTSGTDDTLSAISVTIQDATGSPIGGPLNTNSEGYIEFNVPADSVVIVADGGVAYDFNTTGQTMTANDTIAVTGWNTTITPPSNADYALVEGYIIAVDSLAIEDAIVTVRRAVGNAATSSGYTVGSIYKADTTDSDGYWSLPLLKSNEYTDTARGYYWLEAKSGRVKLWYLDSLYITGSFNVADSL